MIQGEINACVCKVQKLKYAHMGMLAIAYEIILIFL